MKKLLLLLVSFVFIFQNTDAQTWQWTHPEPNGNVSTGNSDYDIAHDVEVDQSGNIYVLGDYTDTLYLNNIYRTTGNGSYLAKYDSLGNLLWYRLIVPIGDAPFFNNHRIKATDLTVNSNGVFITGVYDPTYSAYASKCSDLDGEPLTNKVSYQIGDFSFTSEYDEMGMYITRFDENGNVVWNKLGAFDDCYQNGYYRPYTIIYNSNPLILSDKNNNLISAFVYATNDEKCFFDGATIPLISGNNATNPYYLIVNKLSPSGSLQWSNYAGGGFDVSGVGGGTGFIRDCLSSTIDKNGNIFFYGNTSDSTFFGSNLFRTETHLPASTSGYLTKISIDGNWQFVENLCQYNSEYFYGNSGTPEFLTTDDSNNLYAIIHFFGNGYTGTLLGDTVPIDKTNAYLIKMNNNGSLIWKKGFGTSETYTNSINFSNNNLFINGGIRNFVYLDKPWYFSNLTVKPSSPDYGGSIEYFVAKADTNGNFQWVTNFSSPNNNMVGLGVKNINSDIYTAGIYSGYISTLGNLNGIFNDPTSNSQNIFFGKLKDQYVRIGQITPLTTCPGGNVAIPFTSYGATFSNKNKFIAELSDVNGSFANPTAIGSVRSTGTGTINATIPTTLSFGTGGYKIRIHTTDTLLTGYNYYAYADTGYAINLQCQPATGLAVSNVSATGVTLSWTPPPCAIGYQVQYRQQGTSKWISSIQTGFTKNITALTPNTTYQWRILTGCQRSPLITTDYTNGIPFTTTAAAGIVAVTGNNLEKENPVTNVIAYPNPVKSDLYVQLPSGLNEKILLEVMDMQGKVLYKESITKNEGNAIHVLHVSKLSSGVYILSVKSEKQKVQLKLIKQ